MIRVPIAEETWQAAGIPTIVYDDKVSIRLLDDYQRHYWHDLPRVGEFVELAPERSSMHRYVAQKLGRL